MDSVAVGISYFIGGGGLGNDKNVALKFQFRRVCLGSVGGEGNKMLGL